MTPNDVEDVINNFNLRMALIEQILPTLSTREDLKAFATKEDLKAFSTKEDLKACATKEDLKAFATKEDLKAFATKEELKAFATKEDLKVFPTKEDLAATLSEAKQYTRVLFEDLKGDVQLLAEHVVRLSHAVERIERRLGG